MRRKSTKNAKSELLQLGHTALEPAPVQSQLSKAVNTCHTSGFAQLVMMKVSGAICRHSAGSCDQGYKVDLTLCYAGQRYLDYLWQLVSKHAALSE